MLMRLLRRLGSIELAVTLIVLLAAVLSWATCLEVARGREYAHWYVYDSRWFTGLLGILSLNILAATLIRFPWKRKQTGFVVTHAGLLVILAGAIQTASWGIEGRLSLGEGQGSDRIRLTDRSVITVRRFTSRGPRATEFSFRPGPVDWPDGQVLDFGVADGLGLKILKYYRHARRQVEWVEDPSDYEGAAIQLALLGPRGKPLAQDWLVGNRFGGQCAIGPTQYQLLPIPVASMVQDFLEPPTGNLGRAGILSVHYFGKMYRIPVDGNVGKRIPVGDSKLAIEIAEYLPHAQPTPDGHFVNRDDRPDNPILELRVHLPGEDTPRRQLAFAKLPLLNLDAVHGRDCPVKFWYHHPALRAISGARFLQTPAGRLYCRVVADGAYQPAIEVSQGDRIEIDGGFTVLVERHLAHARRKVTYVPAEPDEGGAAGSEAVVLVEVFAAGQSKEIWLARNTSADDFQTITTAHGPVMLAFGYEEVPLGFRIELEKFTRRTNPGRFGDASLTSTVRVSGAVGQPDRRYRITMNQPLVQGRFTFYQSGVRRSPGAAEVSVLSVTSDPGRMLKYLGSAMVCAGIFLMFFIKSHRSGGGADRGGKPSMRIALPTWMTTVLIALPLGAGQREGEVFRWDLWSRLAVEDGGRQKPFDTLAWETLRTLSNRSCLTDPGTGQRLEPKAFYLAILFDWQGWNQPPSGRAFHGVYQRAWYFSLHRPDKWDRAPLLRVDLLALREALGLAEGERYVSPLDLSRSKIDLRHWQVKAATSNRVRPFLGWAEELAGKDPQRLTRLEKKALELAGKVWAYQDHRMGVGLRILPNPDSEEEMWLSLAELVQSRYTDQTDSTGKLRAAQQSFRKARAAYVARSPGQFNEASRAFVAALSELGPQRGAYPSATTMALEVWYNHWAPFRFAWILMLVGFGAMLVSMGARFRLFAATGWLACAAALVAMSIGFAVRVAISGRAPVTNMYESVIYFAWGAVALGLVFERMYRKKYILTAAAAVATVALILADNGPAAMDPRLSPLQPVLRSNFWLVTHVMTITLSYAAFGLAFGISNIALGYFLVGSRNDRTIDGLTRFSCRAIEVGVLLLAAGTLLGAIWADYAWGRFWGWDPKEVWALIALLGYLAVLHARHAGWVRRFGLAVLSVLCFSLVIMAWYGVNFVLGAGLHSYGFGGGGQAYVFGAFVLQAIYIAAAGIGKALTRGSRAAPASIGRTNGTGDPRNGWSGTSPDRSQATGR